MARLRGRDGKFIKIRSVDKGLDAIMRKAAIDARKGVQIYDVGFTDPVATRASASEFGTDRVQSRPFMRTTFDSNEKRYESEMVDRAVAISGATSGDPRPVEETAEDYARDLKSAINTWTSPANAESTQKAKGTNSPLRDSGEMANSIEVIES